MSFLANLRQQHLDKQTLRLVYTLSLDAIKHCLHLQLSLHDSLDIKRVSSKAYKINREHLRAPPAFLSEADLSILRALLQLDEASLGKDELALPPSTRWSLLKSIIATGCCFFRSTAHRNLIPLQMGSSLNAEARWLLDPSAHYRVDWQIANKNAWIIPLHRDLIYLQIGNNSKAVLGCTENKAATSESRNYWHWQQLRIAAYSPQNRCSNECGDNKSESPLPLSLPEPLSVNESYAELKALLHCRSDNNNSGSITLQFSLIKSDYCSLPQSFTSEAELELNKHYWDGKQVQRIVAKAEQLNELLSQLHSSLDDLPQGASEVCHWLVDKPKRWQRLLVEMHPQFQAMGVEYCFDSQFKYRYISCESWQIQIQESNDKHILFDIALHTNENNIFLKEILAQLQQYNQQFGDTDISLPLENGRILLIPASEAKSLLDELEGLTLTSHGFSLDYAQRYRLANIQDAVAEKSAWSGNLDYLNQALAVKQSPAVLDSKFSAVKAQLRPYQWLGVCWIHHLKQHGYNGLLADDMGLGKTLQTITLLAFEKQQALLNQPALIVVPLSLIHNWVMEIQTFAPQLNTLVIHGNKRHQHWASIHNIDILITTYHSLCLDLDKWLQQGLSWLILDEAQHIKNPATRWSQSVRQIPCNNRLCLSGTPVENHLGELWSILDFLMPGCLGGQRHFQQQFRKAIEVDGNEGRLQQLLTRVAPFILRRTKDQIAKDLPPKTEISQRIELDSEQRNFYNQIKEESKLALQAQLELGEKNSGKKQIAALNAILKLRQACCDPALVSDSPISCPSAKKDHCIEMIESLVAEQRAILVFSQFTQMLKLLKTALDQRQIASLTLTGSTQNRAQVIEAFQAGEAPVFLISLKAGGTGLNLTRADTVIHYDPWWNASLQKQASDRAHRIGQDKPVFVYKLIAANSIEEKVEQLQEKKALLSQHIDNQAQTNAKAFALNFEQLLKLFYDDE